MKILIIFSIIVLCFFLNVSLVLADDCRRSGTPIEELKRSTLVFSGKVVEVNRQAMPANSVVPAGGTISVAKFKVDKWWKGGGKEINIPFGGVQFSGYSVHSGSTFYFEKDQEYLVYACGMPFSPHTDRCDRTKRLSQAQEDLAALKEGVSPDAKIECPLVNIRKWILDASTASWIFEAEVRNIDPQIQLNYKWWYFVGNKEMEIKSGQNTAKITVENADTHIGISAYVSADGIPAGCINSVGLGGID